MDGIEEQVPCQGDIDQAGVFRLAVSRLYVEELRDILLLVYRMKEPRRVLPGLDWRIFRQLETLCKLMDNRHIDWQELDQAAIEYAEYDSV